MITFWNSICFSNQMYPRERSLYFQKKKNNHQPNKKQPKKTNRRNQTTPPTPPKSRPLPNILLLCKKPPKEGKREVRMVHLPIRKLKKPKQTHNYGRDFSNKDPLYEGWARFLFHINLSRSELALLTSVVSIDLYQFFVPWESRILHKLLVHVNAKG